MPSPTTVSNHELVGRHANASNPGLRSSILKGTSSTRSRDAATLCCSQGAVTVLARRARVHPWRNSASSTGDVRQQRSNFRRRRQRGRTPTSCTVRRTCATDSARKGSDWPRLDAERRRGMPSVLAHRPDISAPSTGDDIKPQWTAPTGGSVRARVRPRQADRWLGSRRSVPVRRISIRTRPVGNARNCRRPGDLPGEEVILPTMADMPFSDQGPA
jgi:hypothetical protein